MKSLLPSNGFMIGFFSGIVISGLTAFMRKILSSDEEDFHDTLFFSPPQMHFTRQVTQCESLACPLCSFNRLCALLRTAKDQLDICMYLLTEPEITNIIVRLHRKGVKVRLIVDKQMDEEANKSKTGVLYKHKVPFKVFDTKGMMHNKFTIIDKKQIITGSCNWTHHGFFSNYENILVITNRKITARYCKYFESLWNFIDKV